MIRRIAILSAAVTVAFPALAGLQTAPQLLDAMLAAERARAEGVSDYVMDVVLMNQQSTQYYERTRTDAAGGRRVQTFRLVPFDEVRRRLESEPGISPADLEAMAGSVIEMGSATVGADLPPGMAGALRSGSAGTNPGSGSWTLSELEQVESFARSAEIVGRDSIDGRSAYVVEADGLSMKQQSDGQEFEVRTITLWVDTDDLVLLKMRMDGVIEEGGESREMFLEKHDRDYRTVPGSRMLLPYKTLLRMGGVLSRKQQREMEQARSQLADLDRQLASMPPEQKRMMQSMMGPQIETLRKMVEGEAFEIETTVREIRVNQGLSGAFARPARVAPRAASLPGGSIDGHRTSGPGRFEQDAEALQRAREACLQQKAEAAKASKKKKKRFGKLLGAMGRIVKRHAGGELAASVRRVTGDIYNANATARDMQEAADALGITQDDIAACENPTAAQ